MCDCGDIMVWGDVLGESGSRGARQGYGVGSGRDDGWKTEIFSLMEVSKVYTV